MYTFMLVLLLAKQDCRRSIHDTLLSSDDLVESALGITNPLMFAFSVLITIFVTATM